MRETAFFVFDTTHDSGSGSTIGSTGTETPTRCHRCIDVITEIPGHHIFKDLACSTQSSKTTDFK